MSEEELRMSFTEHLGELRDRLIRSAIAVGVCAIVCYGLSSYIFQALAWPIKVLEKEVAGVEILPEPDPPAEGEEVAPPEPAPEPVAPPAPADAAATMAAIKRGESVWLNVTTDELLALRIRVAGKTIEEVEVAPLQAEGEGLKASWTVLNPLEPLIVTFKIAGYGGLFLAFPYVLYQLCAFVFPGLHPDERRVAQYLIAGCSTLAIAGVCVAYFGVLPFILPYLAQFVPEDVSVQLRMNETISMIVYGLLGFGIAFQFPMVVLVLVYLGVLTPDTLRQYRKIVIVGLAFVSAMFTPPDPISMTMMLLPLVLLYEVSIWVSYLVIRRRERDRNVVKKEY